MPSRSPRRQPASRSACPPRRRGRARPSRVPPAPARGHRSRSASGRARHARAPGTPRQLHREGRSPPLLRRRPPQHQAGGTRSLFGRSPPGEDDRGGRRSRSHRRSTPANLTRWASSSARQSSRCRTRAEPGMIPTGPDRRACHAFRISSLIRLTLSVEVALLGEIDWGRSGLRARIAAASEPPCTLPWLIATIAAAAAFGAMVGKGEEKLAIVARGRPAGRLLLPRCPLRDTSLSGGAWGRRSTRLCLPAGLCISSAALRAGRGAALASPWVPSYSCLRTSGGW